MQRKPKNGRVWYHFKRVQVLDRRKRAAVGRIQRSCMQEAWFDMVNRRETLLSKTGDRRLFQQFTRQ
jgi:hypothetical protein